MLNIKKLTEDLNKVLKENRYATEEDMYNGTVTEDEYLDSFEYIYSNLVNGNISIYKKMLKRLYNEGELKAYKRWCDDSGVDGEIIEFLENYNQKRKVHEADDSKLYTLRDAVKEVKENLEDYDDDRIDEYIDEEIDRVLTYNEDTMNMWKELFMSSSANNGNEVINLMQDDIRSYLRDKVSKK